MKKITLVLIALSASPALAQGFHLNDGYIRRDGTYVEPHYQTNPDSSRMNNWSTQGNVNPFTGQVGTVNPYSGSSSSYGGSRRGSDAENLGNFCGGC